MCENCVLTYCIKFYPMKNKYLFVLLLVLASVSPELPACGNGHYGNNRYPLLTKPYMELPVGSIKPAGWLEEQLHRMANGMTAEMDVIYEKVMGPRNGWLGGDGDVWERGPY